MPESETPTEMKRLVVESPGDGKSVSDCTVVVQTVPVPKPSQGEVLIRVSAAPVNPSDYGSWHRGSSHDKNGTAYPMAMGKEGCGVVVATGSMLVGLRCPVGTGVGFVLTDTKQGSYSEYVTVNALTGVFPMPSDVPIEDCASFFVNPYTAVGILDTAREETGSSVIVHTAAASQLGQMLNKLAPSEGMTIINVVRREEQAELLKGIGAEHVVVTAEPEWKKTLGAKIKELGATCAFDAVAGSTTGDLFEVMPPKGTVYVYGALAGPVAGINPLDLIYRKKKLKGFLLTQWLMNGGTFKMVPRLYSAGGKVNAGLKSGGWSSSQFEDTTMEEAFEKILSLIGTSITGKKLRIRVSESGGD